MKKYSVGFRNYEAEGKIVTGFLIKHEKRVAFFRSALYNYSILMNNYASVSQMSHLLSQKYLYLCKRYTII